MKHPTIALLIPAYNAALTLPELLRATSEYIKCEDTFVVDDGSIDETQKVLRSMDVHVMKHERNLGKGAALRTGIKAILATLKYDAVIFMDADLQHEPAEIPHFIEALDGTVADIILGTRARNESMPIHRKLSNFLTSAIVRLKTGVEIPDSQCGYRAIRLRIFEAVRFYRNGYEAETELLIRALKCGYSVHSIPIRTIYGQAKSHMTHLTTTINFVRVIFET